MDKIDLDAIINAHPKFGLFNPTGTIGEDIRAMLKEAIHQALVLASEKAQVYYAKHDSTTQPGTISITVKVDKQSILDVEKLIV
jgi:hypothetical protein